MNVIDLDNYRMENAYKNYFFENQQLMAYDIELLHNNALREKVINNIKKDMIKGYMKLLSNNIERG